MDVEDTYIYYWYWSNVLGDLKSKSQVLGSRSIFHLRKESKDMFLSKNHPGMGGCWYHLHLLRILVKCLSWPSSDLGQALIIIKYPGGSKTLVYDKQARLSHLLGVNALVYYNNDVFYSNIHLHTKM